MESIFLLGICITALTCKVIWFHSRVSLTQRNAKQSREILRCYDIREKKCSFYTIQQSILTTLTIVLKIIFKVKDNDNLQRWDVKHYIITE